MGLAETHDGNAIPAQPSPSKTRTDTHSIKCIAPRAITDLANLSYTQCSLSHVNPFGIGRGLAVCVQQKLLKMELLTVRGCVIWRPSNKNARVSFTIEHIVLGLQTSYSVDQQLRLELVVTYPDIVRSEVYVTFCRRSGICDGCRPYQGWLRRWFMLPFMANSSKESWRIA